jgi:hypothetical protein
MYDDDVYILLVVGWPWNKSCPADDDAVHVLLPDIILNRAGGPNNDSSTALSGLLFTIY